MTGELLTAVLMKNQSDQCRVKCLRISRADLHPKLRRIIIEFNHARSESGFVCEIKCGISV